MGECSFELGSERVKLLPDSYEYPAVLDAELFNNKCIFRGKLGTHCNDHREVAAAQRRLEEGDVFGRIGVQKELSEGTVHVETETQEAATPMDKAQ